MFANEEDIGWSYRNHEISEDEARVAMEKLGMSDTTIDTMITEWQEMMDR